MSNIEPPEELNEKQKAFCREYLLDLNAGQAYIRAGYSPDGARQNAYRLLGKDCIQEFLAKAMEERKERTEIKGDELLQFWHDLTYTPLDEMFDQGPDGTLVPKSFEEMSDRGKRCVGELKSQFDSDGKGWQTIKRVDQLKASEMLGKSLGIFKDKLELSGGKEPVKVLNIIGVVAGKDEPSIN